MKFHGLSFYISAFQGGIRHTEGKMFVHPEVPIPCLPPHPRALVCHREGRLSPASRVALPRDTMSRGCVTSEGPDFKNIM